ncbi:MAG: hypothetical protein ACRCUF_15650, partial [Aeromonas sobria]
ATILHDYSDRNPSTRQSCTALTARNSTALIQMACELAQINQDFLIFISFCCVELIRMNPMHPHAACGCINNLHKKAPVETPGLIV